MELKEEIEILDREMEKTGEKSSEVMRLKSIMGVGTKLSSRLAGEIGDIRRFKDKQKGTDLFIGIIDIKNSFSKMPLCDRIKKINLSPFLPGYYAI